MPSAPSRPLRIAVVGGGISGLAATLRAVENAPPQSRVTLFDKADRLGGVLQTVHEEGFQIELSADNFITTVPWGLDLCKHLGLTDDLVQTNSACRRTFVTRNDKLHRLPEGFMMMAPTRMWPLAVTPILSPLGKLRAAVEYFLPRCRDERDESMANFVRRRLGREVFERLVEPLVSAVYAADMEKLSLLATLPRFREMERKHGSLIRAMRHSMRVRAAGTAGATATPSSDQSGARYSMFVTLRAGLSSLVEAIRMRLSPETIRLQTLVTCIRPNEHGWTLSISDRPDETFDRVIVATPAPAAGALLTEVDTDLSRKLSEIAYEGTAVLTVAYHREQIKHPMDGMGVVVPRIDNSPILACSFSNQKYPHRAPEEVQLIRIFAGGARRPELAEMEQDDLERLLLPEIEKLLGIEGKPFHARLACWPRTMPQYHIGHLGMVERIEKLVAAHPGLALAGNAYRGVGIPNCIHSGQQAADMLVSRL